jgi:hypothetical protein
MHFLYMFMKLDMNIKLHISVYKLCFIISKLKKINTFGVKLSSTIMKYRQHNNGEKIQDIFRTAPASD